MRRGISVAGLLLAWLCAQGALTEVVQVYAWTRMFVQYAGRMTWQSAVGETLDPNKPCAICCAVRRVREAQEQAPDATVINDTPRLVLLLLDVSGPELAPRRFATRYVETVAMPAEWDRLVPTPPPRRVSA